jgi:hypothetical protein
MAGEIVGRKNPRTYCRVYISERFKPKALMRMRTCPAFGFGIGHCCTLRTSGPPISCMTAAFIVADTARDAITVEGTGGSQCNKSFKGGR